MKFLLSFFIGLFLLACAGLSSSKVTLGTMTDPRDGRTYKTVKIGSQTWMAQNLNYKTDSSFCYKDDTSKCAKYGRFYKLATAVGMPESECGKGKACRLPPGYVQGVCPSGWHLPSKAEWDSLIAVARSGGSAAGKVLKSTWGWKKNNEFFSRVNLLDLFGFFGPTPVTAMKKWLNSGNGSDAFSFSVLPAGCRTDYEKTPYYSEGLQTNFWTSSISGCSSAELVSFHYDGFGVGGGGTAYGDACTANSVRCVKDENVRKVEKPVDPIEVTVDSMTDSRDGQTYKTVKIGSQTWMAQNLNYEMDYSYCFGDDTANCDKYGRLYKWNAANSACPEGWYLPSKAEWDTLFSIVGGDSTAGKILKSTSGWDACGDGTDAVSFSVLPAGLKNPDGWWFFKGEQAVFWSSTEVDSSIANSVELVYRFDNAQVRNYNKDLLFSIRCLKGNDPELPSKSASDSVDQSSKSIDAAPPVQPFENSGVKGEKGSMTDARDGRTYKTVKIGEQTWMAENLNFEMADSYCYSDSASYCNKYGRLYTWAAANSACPEGWHLPSETEWNALFRVVEKRTSISWALRSSSGWDRNKSVNPFGFSALPAGERYINHIELRERDGRRFIDDRPEYRAEGGGAYFWGSTEKRDSKDDQWYSVRLDEYKVFATSDSDRYLDCRPHCYRNYAYSIRCLKD